MSKLSELENRAFQLSQLENEGKSLCEAIHRNNEELIFSAEDLDEESLEAVREVLQQETTKQEPVRISRRRFLMGTREILKVWHDTILGAQVNVMEIERTLESERANRVMGAKMEYYLDSNGSFTFRAMDKKPIGFTEPKKRDVKDSGVWLEAQQERQAKQNERGRTAIKSD